MEIDEEWAEFRRWIGLINKSHGYAGIFNYQSETDKKIVERTVIEEWSNSLTYTLGVKVASIETNASEPPDFFVDIGGKNIGVELVQLVNQKHKHRAAHNEFVHSGSLFQDMQWTDERLTTEISNIIDRKSERYDRRGIEIDVLLIFSAEPWLTAGQLDRWIRTAEIAKPTTFKCAFLLLDYESGRGTDSWPLFPLFGDIDAII
ncbi:hypothetical protein [Martelella endophytica]|uniref:Uncharacterized protein n=1 Tax=Martelella endophytica TaxID=1486262 RepID=A0A0D5LUU4_MAREN|nr:hypothetical protein [Martelella endophytica]AJY47527.1 hypothetical protein TM49_20605 [Martelella endophytica]